jgi:predicted alpha/beta-hydrolase family hydrolase
MQTACADDRVKGLIGLGVPYRAEGRSYSYEFLEHCGLPKLFISGTEDQFGPRDAVEPMLQRAAEPKKLIWIEGAEHFFQGTASSPGPKLDQMQSVVRQWLAETYGLGQT